ncbi:annexin A7-like isoform X1 [Erpetoichthys calabaricus]|uniref:annexin A7-like isoform X1 n=1 Tax=Erpetoichthys calabaricus TaxID=27687 RepID=UPI0022348380|nr:annexin A7-like isoform X1 [Erpetoichthys calabaricus]
MSYPGYPPSSGFPPSYSGYPPQGSGDSMYPPAAGQFQFPGAPGGYPQMGGSTYPPGQAGGFPGAGGFPPQQGPGGYPAPGGFPQGPAPGGYPGFPGASPGQGYPAAPGAPGFGGYPQPQGQSYGGGGGQMPQPGGYPGGPVPGGAVPGGPIPGQHPMPSQTYFGGMQFGDYDQAQWKDEQPHPGMGFQAYEGTIKPHPQFNAQSDAEILRKAMKGFGTDEQAIIDVVSRRTNDERQKIKAMFKTMYGKDLIKDLKSELSGHMEEVILALFMPTTYYDAWSLRHAMKGAGTQEKVLIEILCTRDNQQIREIVRCYNQEFGRDLERDIRKDTSGHFERLLVSMCQGNRDENQNVDMQKAQEDAQRLYQAGEGKLGTDESCFNMILATRSFPQLRATVEAYSRLANRDLISSINREFSGYVEDGLKAIVQCALNRPAFFAERLFKAMHGMGTDDSTLTRVIVSRSEIDLVQIKQMFMQMHNKTLRMMIEGDTSGDYKRLLMAIVGQ